MEKTERHFGDFEMHTESTAYMSHWISQRMSFNNIAYLDIYQSFPIKSIGVVISAE